MDRDKENLTSDEQRISDLIGALRHVDAPGDFDTRVRARIATRRDEQPRTHWLPVLAGVVAVAVLAFGGYLALRPLNSGGGAPAREIANSVPTAPAPVVVNQPSVSVPAPAATQETVPSLATGKQPNGSTNTRTTQSVGGSYDEALHQSNSLHQPNRLSTKGYDPSRPAPPANAGLGTAEIPVTMIFEAIGVHVTWNGGWHVDSVAPKNVAARSGVHPGDFIEAINGQPVAEQTSFKGSFSGKSIRVRRDGAVVDLAFKP
jgi:membrane-associated protease RseP (regulator of RpoE activity)